MNDRDLLQEVKEEEMYYEAMERCNLLREMEKANKEAHIEDMIRDAESKEGGIRDLTMRMKGLQYELLYHQNMSLAILEKMNSLEKDLEEEVRFSKRTFRWIDCPRRDSDSDPDIIYFTGNMSKRTYASAEFKHIQKDGRRWMNNDRLVWNWKNYTFLHWIEQANQLGCPAILVSYKYTSVSDGKFEKPIFFVEPMNEIAKEKLLESGFSYPKYEGLIKRSGEVLDSKKALALSEREYVFLEYFLRDKTSSKKVDEVAGNILLSDRQPTKEEVYEYWSICMEEEE